VCALLYDAAPFDDHDPIRMGDGGKPVGDDKGGALFEQPAQGLLNEILDEDPNPIGLITILSTNFELMLIARACMDAGYREDMIKKNILDNAKVAEFRARKAIEQCRYMDAPSTRKAIQKLSALDFDAKQGNVVLKNDLYAVLSGIYGI
jgi:DNA polymerase III delta subunit